MHTIAEAAAGFDAGAKSRGLIEESLARINDRSGEGARTFLKVHAEESLAAADFYDRMRASDCSINSRLFVPASSSAAALAMVCIPQVLPRWHRSMCSSGPRKNSSF